MSISLRRFRSISCVCWRVTLASSPRSPMECRREDELYWREIGTPADIEYSDFPLLFFPRKSRGVGHWRCSASLCPCIISRSLFPRGELFSGDLRASLNDRLTGGSMGECIKICGIPVEKAGNARSARSMMLLFEGN